MMEPVDNESSWEARQAAWQRQDAEDADESARLLGARVAAAGIQIPQPPPCPKLDEGGGMADPEIIDLTNGDLVDE
jgi:hypothetical protein